MDRGHARLVEARASLVTMIGAPDQTGRPLSIRPAKTEDVPEIVALLRAWINETPWMPELHSQSSMLRFWGGRVSETVTVLAESPCGVLGFMTRDQDCLSALYLASEARGRGIGKALLDTAKQGADPLKLWVFEANHRARAFYEREGFSEVRRTSGDNEEELPDILMKWSKPA